MGSRDPVPGRRVGIGLLSLCAWPLEGHANTGVPLFSNWMAYSWLLLIPIIGVEAYVFIKRLRIPLRLALTVATFANIASTLLGSVIVFALGLFGATEHSGQAGDIAVLVGLVPCYFLTVWCEFHVAAPRLEAIPERSVRAAILVANGFSYAMLAILAVTRLMRNALAQGGVPW